MKALRFFWFCFKEERGGGANANLQSGRKGLENGK